jgi:hypothetical protein
VVAKLVVRLVLVVVTCVLVNVETVVVATLVYVVPVDVTRVLYMLSDVAAIVVSYVTSVVTPKIAPYSKNWLIGLLGAICVRASRTGKLSNASNPKTAHRSQFFFANLSHATHYKNGCRFFLQVRSWIRFI